MNVALHLIARKGLNALIIHAGFGAYGKLVWPQHTPGLLVQSVSKRDAWQPLHGEALQWVYWTGHWRRTILDQHIKKTNLMRFSLGLKFKHFYIDTNSL